MTTDIARSIHNWLGNRTRAEVIHGHKIRVPLKLWAHVNDLPGAPVTGAPISDQVVEISRGQIFDMADAITKICTLPLLAGPNITSDFTVKTVAACIDLVVHCVRSPGGNRYVNEVLSIRNRVEAGQIESSTLFERRDGSLRASPGADWEHEKFDLAGINVAELMAV